jgi:hypothetical protein
MSSATDYIAIAGFRATSTEIFEGRGGDVTITSSGGGELDLPQPLQVQLISESSSTDLTPLWNAQTTVIYEQNERLDLIYTDLENKRNNLEDYDFDWGEVFLEGLLETGFEWGVGWLINWLKKAKDYVLPDGIEFLVDYAINTIPNAVDFLLEQYRKARSQIGAIKTENNELLALLPSWDNYYLRLEVLKHHEEAVKNLLQEIFEHEQPLNNALGGDLSSLSDVLEKIENTLSGRAEDDEDEDLKEFWDDVDETLLKIMPAEDNEEGDEESDEENCQLPALPDKYPAGTLTRFFHTYLKLQAYQVQQIATLNENLALLQFNGERLHLPNGDIVELTGIGTVTASPDEF